MVKVQVAAQFRHLRPRSLYTRQTSIRVTQSTWASARQGNIAGKIRWDTRWITSSEDTRDPQISDSTGSQNSILTDSRLSQELLTSILSLVLLHDQHPAMQGWLLSLSLKSILTLSSSNSTRSDHSAPKVTNQKRNRSNRNRRSTWITRKYVGQKATGLEPRHSTTSRCWRRKTWSHPWENTTAFLTTCSWTRADTLQTNL